MSWNRHLFITKLVIIIFILNIHNLKSEGLPPFQRSCIKLFSEFSTENPIQFRELATEALAFARKFKLPKQVIKNSTPSGERARLLVGIDVNNTSLLDAYKSYFNPKHPLSINTPGVIVSEDMKIGSSSTLTLRLGDDFIDIPKNDGIVGYSTLYPLLPDNKVLTESGLLDPVTIVFYNGKKGRSAFSRLSTPKQTISAASVINNSIFSVDDVITKIPDGAKILFPVGAGSSSDALEAIFRRAPFLEKGMDLYFQTTEADVDLLKRLAEVADKKIRIHALFIGKNLRNIYREGNVTYHPGYLGDFGRMLKNRSNPDINFDAVVVRVSTPNKNTGRLSLGPNCDLTTSLLEGNPNALVIAEINSNTPNTYGKNGLDPKRVTGFFRSDHVLGTPAVNSFTAIEEKIGIYLGELVDSDAYVQVGVGNIFSGLASGLKKYNKRGIRVWSEMFSDPLMEAMKNGTVTDAKVGFAYGSQDFYKWLNNNKSVQFLPFEEINKPGEIAKKPKFHALNTAVQVSLLGDANATMGLNNTRISGPGGQVEFMSGASRSNGGKAVIAIRSTAKNGELSTIVLNPYAGPVTTPHESVTHVVTEYGVAVLAGKSEANRVIEMINIAHPKFRHDLAQQAINNKLLKESDLVKVDFITQALPISVGEK